MTLNYWSFLNEIKNSKYTMIMKISLYEIFNQLIVSRIFIKEFYSASWKLAWERFFNRIDSFLIDYNFNKKGINNKNYNFFELLFNKKSLQIIKSFLILISTEIWMNISIFILTINKFLKYFPFSKACSVILSKYKNKI